MLTKNEERKKMRVPAQMILRNRGLMFTEQTIIGHKPDSLFLYWRWLWMKNDRCDVVFLNQSLSLKPNKRKLACLTDIVL